MRRSLGLLLVGLVWASATARPDEPARKAVAYLSIEVPRWSRENHCFSCHNNGDGARALYLAKSADPASLAETTRWLRRPEAWDAQGNAGPATDKRLARLQFAAALATAVETGATDDRPALHRAVEQLVADLGREWLMGGRGGRRHRLPGDLRQSTRDRDGDPRSPRRRVRAISRASRSGRELAEVEADRERRRGVGRSHDRADRRSGDDRCRASGGGDASQGRVESRRVGPLSRLSR